MRNGCPQGYQFASAPGPSCIASVPAADSSRLSSAWTLHNLPQYGAWSDNAYSPTLRRLVVTNYTAGSAGSKIMTSDDGGVTWTLRTSSDDTIGWNAITWSPDLNLFVALAHGGTAGTYAPAMTSPDGITWTGSNSAAFDQFFWDGVAWSPALGLFAATAANQSATNIQTSADGVTWTVRASADIGGLRRVLWVRELGLFVATSNTCMQTSPDGIAWTRRTSPSPAVNLGRIAWSPLLGLIVAAGLGPGSGNRVITSPDGVAWTARASVDDTADWLGVAWSARFALFAALSSTGRVMTSFDGARWTDRGTPIAATGWNDFCWLDDFGWFVGFAVNTTPGIELAGVVTSPL
jgi:hypothetical protein